MDVLSDILDKVKLSSAVYFKSDFSTPWGMDVPDGPFAQFHIVTRGQCILRTNGTNIQLFAGDLVIFPLGTGHWIADKSTSVLTAGSEVVEAIQCGNSLFKGTTVATTLICGHFEFDKTMEHPFIQELPQIIHIKDTEKRDLVWLESITNLVIQETGSKRMGSEVIVNKLAEILFVHALRAYIQNYEANIGFVTAMRDPRINKVLKAIHQDSQDDWQLISLAQLAGMSRTSFSNQFKKLVGDTPLNYITQWRILQAKDLLKNSNKPIGTIALTVGYQSKAAFNRVFKKRATITPLKYRQMTLAS